MFKKILAFLISFIIFTIYSYSQQQEERITITTYYPSPYGSYRNLDIYGSVIFRTAQPEDDVRIYSNTAGGGTWLVIKGGADDADRIWIGGDGDPDFVTGQISLWADRTVISGDLDVWGRFAASQCVDYTAGVVTQCPANYYAVACGSGSCNNPGNLANPASCPQNGYMICVRHAD